MKRLKFKKPFNGMDNAKKLIPESYKIDGNEFEITDGNETYRVKWESGINEGTILSSSNKVQINEDMKKMKHLMGFKSQETLGTLKGAERINEDKTFNKIWNKTKNLLNEDYGVHDNGQLDMFADQDEVNKLDKLSIKKEKFSKGLMDEIIDYVSDGEIIFDFSKKGFTDDVNKNLNILFNDKELLGTILNNILHDINDDIELEKETGDDYSSLSRLKDEVVKYLDILASRMNYRDSPSTNNDSWKWEDRERMKHRIEAKFYNHNPRLKLINSEDHNRHSEFGNGNLVIVTNQSSPELEYKLQKLASENGWGFESFLDGLYLMYQGNGYGNDDTFLKEMDGGMESGVSSIADIAKELKAKGASISKANFTTRERGVVGKLLDIVDELSKESNGFSSQVLTKLEGLTSAIDTAITKSPTQGDATTSSIGGNSSNMGFNESEECNECGDKYEMDRFDEIFAGMYEEGEDFPDLTGDGKVTQADILKGRGVFEDEE